MYSVPSPSWQPELFNRKKVRERGIVPHVPALGQCWPQAGRDVQVSVSWWKESCIRRSCSLALGLKRCRCQHQKKKLGAKSLSYLVIVFEVSFVLQPKIIQFVEIGAIEFGLPEVFSLLVIQCPLSIKFVVQPLALVSLLVARVV